LRVFFGYGLEGYRGTVVAEFFEHQLHEGFFGGGRDDFELGGD
jgi:hypothetical protein